MSEKTLFATVRIMVCGVDGHTVEVGPGDNLIGVVDDETAEVMCRLNQAAEEWPAGAPAEGGPEGGESVDYSSMTKVELVALADLRGIDSSGTKAEIIVRLIAADE